MPKKPITMRKLKEIIRQKYQAKLGNRQIAASLSISAGTVSTYLNRAILMGINSWPIPDDWDDARLDREFLQTKITPRTAIPVPDWPQFELELKRKGVTKQLLWQEYAERNADNHYSYPQLCRHYKEWKRCQQPSMRQTHKAGEKLFIDYCGPTLPLVNPDTGEFRTAQIFVAVLGASNYTFAEATLSQKLEDWVMSHSRAFDFFGGVPELLIPDNLKSGTTRACKYEPDLNPTYQQLAAHYNVTILPARPRKPKDKAKAENGVLIVERWIMAVLRHETFYSLTQLNQRIEELLLRLNTKPFQKLEGDRTQLFNQLDKPALKPLPVQSYQYTYIKLVKVSVDYHIEIDKNYYSVPYALLHKKLEAQVTAQTICIYHKGQCVAQHHRSYQTRSYSTKTEHMPKAHQDYANWKPERFNNWAEKLGDSVVELVQILLASKEHPQQSYKSCLGLLNLSKSYPNERLNAACKRGIKTGAYRLKNIKAILNNNLDQQQEKPKQLDLLLNIDHENLRNKEYYQ